MLDRLRPLVALAALALVLAACGTTEPGPTPLASVSGSVSASGSPVLGAGLALAEAGAFGTAAVGPSTVIEVGTGLYVGPVSAVADGEFTLVLPDASDLPAAVLALAGDALVNADVADCTVVVDVPTAVLTTFAVGYGTIPGPYVVTVDGGLFVAFMSDVALDLGAPTPEEALSGQTLYGWVHASEAVELTIEGAGCTSGTPAGVAGSAALEAGWNQVAWDLNATATLATLRNDDGTADLVMTVSDSF